jgi:hypothetical protein
MTNRIRALHLHDRLLDPAEPEVWVGVVPERRTATTDVRGRLMGPRCHYATTVEVAYPLQPFARPPEELPGLARRVVIPEASLWEPQCPFLYQGPVELWEDGQLRDQLAVSRGLRAVNLGSRGLRLNGRSFTVRGVARDHLPDEEAGRLREAGCNTLLAPVASGTASLWDRADRLGFFLLGRTDGGDESFRLARALQGHPSCLGWLLGQAVLERGQAASQAASLATPLIGVELHREPPRPLPEGIRFVFCPETLLPSLAEVSLPKMVSVDEESFDGGKVGRLLSLPGVLGVVVNR